MLLLAFQNPPIVWHGIAQLAPEERISPLQVGVQLEVGPQFAIDAIHVLQFPVENDDDPLALVLQSGLVGDPELHAGPHRIDEVLRQHNDHSFGVIHSADDLLRNTVAHQPIAIV